MITTVIDTVSDRHYSHDYLPGNMKKKSLARKSEKLDIGEVKKYLSEKFSYLFECSTDSFHLDSLHAAIVQSLQSIPASFITCADIDQILFSALRKNYAYPLNDIELFVTENCNLRCDYCFVKTKSPKSMTENVAFTAVDYLLNESGGNEELNITFFGGEPLLEFDLIKRVIEYVDSRHITTKKNVFYSLTTNGTIANHEMLSFFQGRFNLLLSIDGDQHSHDKHRTFIDGTPTFDRIMANLELLKQYQPWLGTRMTVSSDVVNHLADNVKYLFSQGIRQFLIGQSYGVPWNEDSLAIYKNQMMDVLRFYTRLKKLNEPIRIPLFEKDSSDAHSMGNAFGCRAGRNSLTVSPSGNLYPCSMMLGLNSLATNDYCLGNVFDGITELHLRDDFISLHCPENGPCASCDIAGYCRGGCPAQNYHTTGSIDKPAKYTCEIARINNSLADEYAAIMKETETCNTIP